MEKRKYTHDINTAYMQSMYVGMCVCVACVWYEHGKSDARSDSFRKKEIERERQSFSFEQLEREAQTLEIHSTFRCVSVLEYTLV